MQWLFLGIIVLGLLVLVLDAFTRANPAALARSLRLVAGFSALAIAAILTLLGRIGFGLVLGAIGLMLVGGRGPFSRGFPGGGRPTPGQRSRVRTATLEMTLDHDTGEIDGEVQAGPMVGARLSVLDLDDLLALRRACAGSDPKAVPLIEAFLDHAHAGWREGAGAGAAGSHEQSGMGGGAMSREEAYEILGLPSGASVDAIRHAHRNLMKKLHPDQGGSNYLAAKINEAKDLLLGN